jgi:WD40 repeat protein
MFINHSFNTLLLFEKYMKTKKHRKQKIWLAFSILLLFLIALLAYYQFFYKAKEINSNIFKVDKIIAAHHGEVWVARFSPAGNLIASGSVDSTVKIYDYHGNIIHNLQHPAGVTSLNFNHDGSHIITGSYDAVVRLWDVTNGTLIKTFKGHTGTVWSVAFSPDGKTIASCSEDKTIKLWDAETGTCIKIMKGHALNIWSIKFTPDGSKIISGSFDKTIKIWNAVTGELIRTISGHTEAIVDVAVSADGQTIASASDDKTIKLWRVSDGKLLHTLQGGDEHVQGLAFSSDGKRLISSGRDKPVIGEFLQNFFDDSKYNKGVSMRLWDLENLTVIQTFEQHANDVNDVAFSLDDKWIVSASSDKTVCLWHSSF